MKKENNETTLDLHSVTLYERVFLVHDNNTDESPLGSTPRRLFVRDVLAQHLICSDFHTAENPREYLVRKSTGDLEKSRDRHVGSPWVDLFTNAYVVTSSPELHRACLIKDIQTAMCKITHFTAHAENVPDVVENYTDTYLESVLEQLHDALELVTTLRGPSDR